MNQLETSDQVGSGVHQPLRHRASLLWIAAAVVLAAAAVTALSSCGDVSLLNNLAAEDEALPIELGPNGKNVTVNTPVILNVTGGVGPFVYAAEGPGVLMPDEEDPDGPTITYKAPRAIASSQELAKVDVTDFLGKRAAVTVLVHPPLALRPSTAFSLYRSATQDLAISGGVPPYSVSPEHGNGRFIDESTYRYTPPDAGDSDTLLIRDSVGNQRFLAVTVQDPPAPGEIVLTPPSATIALEERVSFVVTGGTAPYVYTLAGAGSISDNGDGEGSTVTYEAPDAAVTATITVEDDAGKSATFKVEVLAPPVPIAVTFDGKPSAAKKIQMAWGGTILVEASGGIPPYTFEVKYSEPEEPPHGELSGSGASRTYTAPPDTGRNKVTEFIVVGDSGGSTPVSQQVEVKKAK